jgi:hypothetical protein
MGMRTGFIWLRTGTSGGSFECREETSGSIKDRQFLGQLGELSGCEEGLCFFELFRPVNYDIHL